MCILQVFVAAGAGPGSILGSWSSDHVGRRGALLVYGILNIIGWLLIFLAQYVASAPAFRAFLLFGRLWTGVTTGALASIVPVSFFKKIGSFCTEGWTVSEIKKCISCG